MEILSPHEANASSLPPKFPSYFKEKPPNAILFNPYNLIRRKEVVLSNGNILGVDERVRAILPQLIQNGEIHNRLITKFAYARHIFNPEQQAEFADVLHAAELVKGPVSAELPKRSQSLEERLTWTLLDREDKSELSRLKRQETSDVIRETLIPRYHQHGLDFGTQVRLIHRAHTNRYEHLILDKSQASRMLTEDIEYTDRLAGRIRSAERLPINITLADRLFMCPSFRDVPEIFNRLSAMADTYFPINGINSRVNEENIYHYQSFFQLMFAILHPFYEVNGRTSEDLMYILLQRRPDLADTARFVSEDGFRESEAVEERMAYLNNIAAGFGHAVAQICGATPEELEGHYYYDSIFPILKSKVLALYYQTTQPGEKVTDYLVSARSHNTKTQTSLKNTLHHSMDSNSDRITENELTEGVYLQVLKTVIDNQMIVFDAEELVVGKFDHIDRLAHQLANSSPNYKTANGTILGLQTIE